MNFSNKNREAFVDKLKSEKHDLIIIGGGITGAGIALDATTRGMKVALIEMQDFSAGTSSRSTKLIHGGLRYLKQLEIKMVSEVGKERSIVYENGPHVTTPEWMLLPIYKGGTFGKWSTSLGLRIYDYLAGVKKSERRMMLNKNETLAREPLLNKEGLKGAGYYVEYRTDDARLTIEVIKAANEKGATAVHYSKVEKLLYQDEKLVGVLVSDQLTDEIYEIYADYIINAAGPWVDTIRELDRSNHGKYLNLTKGVHLVFSQSRFPLKQAIYFDTNDGRMVFAIPREEKTYVGTTDTFYEWNPIYPKVTSKDRIYLLQAINERFPSIHLDENDIESSWAGVRPLISEEGKKPSEISRKDEIWESRSGLITIAGGKLTGYRKMSEEVVDLIVKKSKEENGRRYPNCKTKHFPISGGNVGGSKGFKDYLHVHTKKGISIGLTEEEARQLTIKYGSNVSVLYKIIACEKDIADRYQLPILLFAKLKYGLEEEMVVTPVDFFSRRTGDLLFHLDVVKKYKDEVIVFLKDYFGWNRRMEQIMKEEMEIAIQTATISMEEK